MRADPGPACGDAAASATSRAWPPGVLILWLCLPLPAEAQERANILLDRIAVVVDGEVITESELVAEVRIRYIGLVGSAATVPPLPTLEEKDFRAGRANLVQLLLIGSEARRRGGIQVPEAELDAAVATFEAWFADAAAYDHFLRSTGISRALVRSSFARRLVRRRIMRRLEESWAAGAQGDQRHSRIVEARFHWLERLRARAKIRVLNRAGMLEVEAR